MVKRLSTEELILESFRELASERPVDDISVQDIVDNCGLSKRSFYNYFQGKDDLLLKEQATASKAVQAPASGESAIGEIRDSWLAETLKYRAKGDYSENVAREMRNNQFIHNGLVEQTMGQIRDAIVLTSGEEAVTPEVEFAIWFWSQAAMHAQERQGAGRIPVPVETWVRWEFDCMPDILKQLLEARR